MGRHFTKEQTQMQINIYKTAQALWQEKNMVLTTERTNIIYGETDIFKLLFTALVCKIIICLVSISWIPDLVENQACDYKVH